MNGRIQVTFGCDVRLQWRNGFYYATIVVVGLNILFLRILPTRDLAWLVPALIVNNVIVNGFYFLSGLVLLEKGEGSLEAQTVTPLRAREYLAAKVATLTLLSLVENVAIVLAAYGFNLSVGLLLAGIALGTGLFALAGFLVVARYDSINAFLVPSIGYVVLLGLPLLPYLGLGHGSTVEKVIYLHPLQPILTLLVAALAPMPAWEIWYGLLAGVVWLGIFWALAVQAYHSFVVSPVGLHRRRQGSLHSPSLEARFRTSSKWLAFVGPLRSLGSIDAISIGRDSMLRWLIFVPFMMALAVRWLLPSMVNAAEAWLSFNLNALYPPLMGFMVLLLVPYLWGMVTGFLLLDQRDDQTLLALQVTPLSGRAYLAYRLTVPALIAAILTAIVLPLTGLFALPPWAVVLLAISVAPIAPLTALALATFAQNKVQGFALAKVAGVVLFPPLATYFLLAEWQWPFALFPTYWPAQFLWRLQANDPTFVLFLIVGLVYQLALLALLVQRFERVMHR